MRLLLLLPIICLIPACMSRPTNTQREMSDRSADVSEEPRLIYDFSNPAVADHWRVEDDVVMGGRSSGNFKSTEDGHGLFSGEVSLENNGGFSSVQYEMAEVIDLAGRAAFQIRLKGDGKTYNFRVKKPGVRYAYTAPFTTKGGGDWETITIPFDSMYATFRGNRVDVPNYAGEPVNTLRFLIGNKKPQAFTLAVAEIAAL